jgi:hypothetical protein
MASMYLASKHIDNIVTSPGLLYAFPAISQEEKLPIQMNYTDILSRYNHFQECILIDYWSENLCRDFVLLIDNIWESAEKLRGDLDNHDIFVLRLSMARRIDISNNFSAGMISHTDQMNWGWNEFTKIDIDEVDNNIHFFMRWNNGRYITVVADNLRIERLGANLEIFNYQLAKRIPDNR